MRIQIREISDVYMYWEDYYVVDVLSICVDGNGHEVERYRDIVSVEPTSSDEDIEQIVANYLAEITGLEIEPK